MPVRVRIRVDADLGPCVRLLEAVHREDGYPTHWPSDPARWLSPRETLGAWVAHGGGVVAGHIVLRATTADGGADVWSAATGLPPEQIAATTRFFVARESRGAGVGGALLDAACAEAAARDLIPALDVVETNRDAIRLYEHRGWQRVHDEVWDDAPDGETMLYYYVAPRAMCAVE
ncbi:MAG TPA: GNAT family N-acetyltransferase [Gaiellaceae bacterium]